MTSKTVLVLAGGDAVTATVALIEPPAPRQPPAVRAIDPPPSLAFHETSRLRTAAYLATRLHPGPIGELIQREILDWSEFGFRFDRHGLVGRLVNELMSAPLPRADSARGRATAPAPGRQRR